MRRVRSLLAALLLCLILLPTSCRFDFQLIEPTVEVDAATKTVYPSGSNIVVYYLFTADEPKLRCKYTVDRAGSVLLQDVTEPFPPGTLQKLEIDLKQPNPDQGEYNVLLMGQALRGGSFISLPFLAKTFRFFLDTEPPDPPEFPPGKPLYSDDWLDIELSHPEWRTPIGSPVSIYYTTDGSTPTEGSTKYLGGTPIIVPNSPEEIVIRAIAVDESGQKSTVSFQTYRFMNIQNITSTGSEHIDEFNTSTPDQFIYINGYGLSTVSSVEFSDSDGTLATTAIVSKANDKVTIAVHIDPNFRGNGRRDDGTIRVFDNSGIFVQKAIDLVPEP